MTTMRHWNKLCTVCGPSSGANSNSIDPPTSHTAAAKDPNLSWVALSAFFKTASSFMQGNVRQGDYTNFLEEPHRSAYADVLVGVFDNAVHRASLGFMTAHGVAVEFRQLQLRRVCQSSCAVYEKIVCAYAVQRNARVYQTRDMHRRYCSLFTLFELLSLSLSLSLFLCVHNNTWY